MTPIAWSTSSCWSRANTCPWSSCCRKGASYTDYEAWRSGELDCLDEMLFGDPEEIAQLLQQAAAYLQQRGWQAEGLVYKNWQDNNPQPLRFSRDSAVNACFHQAYHQPRDLPQMDLFTDSPTTSLANGITLALIDRNTTGARTVLERLYDTAPDYGRLGELECLVAAAESLPDDVGDVAAELRTLQQTLVPLANGLLGKASHNLLIPLWRRLSRALQARAFQASQPDLHRSYTACQSMDWGVAREAIEGEPHWRSEAILLLRHAMASDYLQHREAALRDWFLLCWQHPQQVDALASTGNQALRQHWASFQDADQELPRQAFPAWLLLAVPGFTRLLPQPGSMSGQEEAACPASYRTLYQLQQYRLQAEPTARHGEEMALRAQLQRQDPALFQCFLERVEKSRPE
ncbi:MAG: hypothetical protein ACK5HY_16590 [Parahaliea sp.]